MTTLTATPSRTRGRSATQIAGLVVTVLLGLFLLGDTVSHLLNVDAVREASARLGQPSYLPPVIGAVEAVCLALYFVRRTAVVGAILLTGYFGGATAVNLSTSQPFGYTVFALATGAVVWLALWLRDRQRVESVFFG
jgi:hypothetical protein